MFGLKLNFPSQVLIVFVSFKCLLHPLLCSFMAFVVNVVFVVTKKNMLRKSDVFVEILVFFLKAFTDFLFLWMNSQPASSSHFESYWVEKCFACLLKVFSVLDSLQLSCRWWIVDDSFIMSFIRHKYLSVSSWDKDSYQSIKVGLKHWSSKVNKQKRH